jgi:hypothetical protein
MTMGDREKAHREYKDALNARANAQKLFGIGSAEYLVEDARLTAALTKLGPLNLGLPNRK